LANGAKFSLPSTLAFPSFISGIFTLGIIAALHNAFKYVEIGITIFFLPLHSGVLALFYYFQRQ
jgi:phosphate/sulfate permease